MNRLLKVTIHSKTNQTLRKYRVMLAAVLSLLAMASCSAPENQEDQSHELTEEALIIRGKYLVTVAGCNDCHSPKILTPNGPEPDPTRLLSGHPQDEKLPVLAESKDWLLFSQGLTAFVGPWGVSYAANLTPDITGTGDWSFEQFKTAIRKGKFKGLEGSRSLLPPMPWQMYREMTDDDLQAIFAYLQSITPVSNMVPAPIAPQDLNTNNTAKTSSH